MIYVFILTYSKGHPGWESKYLRYNIISNICIQILKSNLEHRSIQKAKTLKYIRFLYKAEEEVSKTQMDGLHVGDCMV